MGEKTKYCCFVLLIVLFIIHHKLSDSDRGLEKMLCLRDLFALTLQRTKYVLSVTLTKSERSQTSHENNVTKPCDFSLAECL